MHDEFYIQCLFPYLRYIPFDSDTFFFLLDIELPSDYSTIPPKSQELCATPQRLKYLYQRQLQDPGYRRLLDKNVSIFGTFDGT